MKITDIPQMPRILLDEAMSELGFGEEDVEIVFMATPWCLLTDDEHVITIGLRNAWHLPFWDRLYLEWIDDQWMLVTLSEVDERSLILWAGTQAVGP